jgi:microcin C transport system permease protein
MRIFNLNSNKNSLFRQNWNKFKSYKKGYYSLIILITLFILSYFAPVFIGNRALIVRYNGEYYFPIFKNYPAEIFNQYKISKAGNNKEPLYGDANYRLLKRQFSESKSDNWLLLPLYPYGAEETLLEEINENPPSNPEKEHIFGIDYSGRDVFSRVIYGFRISISFALIVFIISFAIGIFIGLIIGYYGGYMDIIGYRLIEVWMTLPFLYIVMIISSIIVPNFLILVIIISIFSWITISLYIRGEVYREKEKDYVIAAKAIGLPGRKILFHHIFPNSLNPVFSLAPFAIIAHIGSLVALDFLGFGLPSPTPSWGQLLREGMNNLDKWWLIVFPILAITITLTMVVLIAEAMRDSFNPKN